MIKIVHKKRLTEASSQGGYTIDTSLLARDPNLIEKARLSFWHDYYKENKIDVDVLHAFIEDFLNKYTVIKDLFNESGLLRAPKTYGTLKTFITHDSYEAECIRVLRALWGVQFSDKKDVVTINLNNGRKFADETVDRNIEYLKEQIMLMFNKWLGDDWFETYKAHSKAWIGYKLQPIDVKANAVAEGNTTTTTYNIQVFHRFAENPPHSNKSIVATMMVKVRDKEDGTPSYQVTLEDVNTGIVPAGVALSAGGGVDRIKSEGCCAFTGKVLARLSDGLFNQRLAEVSVEENERLEFRAPGLWGVVMFTDGNGYKFFSRLNQISPKTCYDDPTEGSWRFAERNPNDRPVPPYKFFGIRIMNPEWQKKTIMDYDTVEEPYGRYYYLLNPAKTPRGFTTDIDTALKLKPKEKLTVGDCVYEDLPSIPSDISNSNILRLAANWGLTKIVKRDRVYED